MNNIEETQKMRLFYIHNPINGIFTSITDYSALPSLPSTSMILCL